MTTPHTVDDATPVKDSAPRQHETQARASSLYQTMLATPMAMLAGNVSERADVSSVAILGYN